VGNMERRQAYPTDLTDQAWELMQHLVPTAVVVTTASVPDRDGAMQLLAVLRGKLSRLQLIWPDQAYSGELITWLWALRPWRNVRLDMVKRPEGIKGFLLLPKLWMVERTFGWVGRYRRLAKDDE
jgi:putative transposase